MANLIQYKQWLLDNPVCLTCKNPIDLTEDDDCKWIAFTKKKLRNGITLFKDFYCIDCYMKSVRRAVVTHIPSEKTIEEIDRRVSQMTIEEFLGETYDT